MMLAGLTGLGLGAASLAFASVPDVAGTIYGCYHDTFLLDSRRQTPSVSPTAPSSSNHQNKEHR